MKILPFNLQQPFFALLLEQGSLSDFETWVYNEPSLEKYLKSDDYLALISLDFADKKNIIDIEKTINPYLDYVAYYHHKLLSHLSSLITNPDDDDIHSDIIRWYVGGYHFLNDLVEAMAYLKDISFGDEEYEGVRVMDFNRGMTEVVQHATCLYEDLANGKLILLAPPRTHAVCYQDLRDDVGQTSTQLSD